MLARQAVVVEVAWWAAGLSRWMPPWSTIDVTLLSTAAWPRVAWPWAERLVVLAGLVVLRLTAWRADPAGSQALRRLASLAMEAVQTGICVATQSAA